MEELDLVGLVGLVVVVVGVSLGGSPVGASGVVATVIVVVILVMFDDEPPKMEVEVGIRLNTGLKPGDPRLAALPDPAHRSAMWIPAARN
jgi:hypothetical protein